MNLFALTNNPAARIVRFPLTQELQAEISAVFAQQFIAFNKGIENVIPFDGRYRPEEGELLAIDDYVDIEGLAHAVANPLTIDQFDPQIHTFDGMKALFTRHEENGTNQILIQLFENRRVIANKGLTMFFSDNTFKRMSESGLTLDTRLLAVLEGGQLKFQSFHFLSRVLDMSEYFKEATADEVKDFANHEKLAVENLNNFVEDASAPIRKKITLILQSGVLDNFTTTQIVAAAQNFKVEIKTTEDGRIALPTNSTELRRLLRFLDEDYYESPLTQTHFVSNSKRVAD
jgi:Domain of unknown function (DUF4868)